MSSATLVYCATDRQVYWYTETHDSVTGDDTMHRYCADRDATYRDWEIGGQRLWGPASTPVGWQSGPRDYLLRWLRKRKARHIKISVRRVESFEALRQEWDRAVAAKQLANAAAA